MAKGYWDVTDYGVFGDGVTDDAPNLQYCFEQVDGAGGGSVWIPSGDYLLNSEIKIFPNTDVRCARNAKFIRGSNAMQYIFKNFDDTMAPTGYLGYSDISITGGIFDARGQTLTNACTAIVFAHAKRITIRDVTIRNVPDWHAIELCAISNAIVDGCNFEGFNLVTAGREISEAVQYDADTSSVALPGIGAGAHDGTRCNYIRFTGNRMDNAQDGSGLGYFGKLFGCHNDVSAAYHSDMIVANNSSAGSLDSAIAIFGTIRAVVSGNTLRDTLGPAAIRCAFDLANAPDNIAIFGNVIDRFAISAIQVDGTGDGATSGAFTRVVITGNICDDLTDTAGNQPNIALWNVTRFEVVGNTCYEADTSGIFASGCSDGVIAANRVSNTTSAGISLSATSDVHISGNKIKETGTHGITLAGGSASNTVQGNTFAAPSRTTNATSYGMHVSNASGNNDNKFVANTVIDGTSGNQGLAGMGFDGANPLRTVVTGNVFQGWGTTYTSVIALNGATILDDISGTGTANTLQT